jgi:hypothetical protein
MADQKQRNQLILLGALVVLAGSVWYFYFGRSGATPAGSRTVSGPYVPINAQDYETVIERMKAAQTAEYKPTGRNIFVEGPAPPPPNAVAQNQKPAHVNVGPTPPPPPPPAQLSMKFYGYGTVPTSGQRKAFLLDGEDVKIVSEGEIVQNHIRITHIGNDRIDFEDTNTGQHGSNPLEAAPAAS